MDELRYTVDTPSLRFGIIEAFGLVLGQEWGRAVCAIGSLLGSQVGIFAEQSAAAKEVPISYEDGVVMLQEELNLLCIVTMQIPRF